MPGVISDRRVSAKMIHHWVRDKSFTFVLVYGPNNSATFMDRMSLHCHESKGVQIGRNWISPLPFADDVLLVTSAPYLKHAREQDAAKCEDSSMR